MVPSLQTTEADSLSVLTVPFLHDNIHKYNVAYVDVNFIFPKSNSEKNDSLSVVHEP